jgi:hypothetical protein
MPKTDHNKIIGIIHIAYGAFGVVVMLLFAIFMVGVFGLVSADRGDVRPLGLMGIVMFFVVALNILLAAPSFLAGYAMLKRKSWAKGAGVVAAILDGLSFPFGTALCVYTLWFMFSNEGKALYDANVRTLPPPPPNWRVGQPGQREFEYVPPAVPPNWR